MRNFLDSLIVEHKSRPPLRWVANLFGSISSWAILKASYLDEEKNFGWKYKVYGYIYSFTWPTYYNYGTFYKIDWDMSGKGWDDYDENGVPYWEKTGTVDPDYDPLEHETYHWDYIDEETGDAFKVINYGRS